MIGKFEFSHHTPTDKEKEILRYVENRREQMDTDYRKKLVDTAQWCKREYDSIPDQRINNLDLFKTGLSRVVVNHRLVMLYDNPSETVYKAVEDSDQYKVEILQQVDKYDKKVSRFAAIDQQLSRTANIEGTAIGMVSWHEVMDGNITIGDISTLTEIIPLKDFYWDPAGIFLNGNSSYTCNDAGYGKVLSMTQFRMQYDKEGYKNVDSVLPNIEQPETQVWSDEWEEGRWSTDGDYVYVFCLKTKKLWDGKRFTDKEFIVANGQVIYDGEMQEPLINQEKWLPFFKIEGIPTGGFGGIGIPALIRHPQEALDRMLTMAEAQAELAVNPVLFYQTTGELLPDTIDYFPGAAYPYKGTGAGIQNDLQFFRQPDITAGAQYIMDKMANYITITTGVDIQALLGSDGTEKAIQTQNKREIQEKILKMSVLWNETHGIADLAQIRMAYLQEYYPSIRIREIVGPNGDTTVESDFPKIKVDGYNVAKGFVNGKTVNKLEKNPGAYSSMTITPEELRFNVDVTIESSQLASGIDTVKQNKWDKMIDSLARIPEVLKAADVDKMVRGTVKFAGFKNSDVLQDRLNESSDSTHPARKEFMAILMSDVIPFEPIMPDSYKPEEYLYVFKEMMQLPEYKKSNPNIKAKVSERLQLHILNFSDPYFEDKQKAGKEAQIQEQVDKNSTMGQTLKPIGGNETPPTDLAGRTRSAAAEIGAKTKEANKMIPQ